MSTTSVTKHINKLHQKKFRKEFGEFLIEGIKGIAEAIQEDADIVSLVVDGKRRDEEDIAHVIRAATQKRIPVEYCGRKEVAEIKTTETFAGVLAIVAMPETSLDDLDAERPIVCLNKIGDPGNLGTIIRTADWFGVEQLLLSEGSVDPYNEKVVRSTMGSIFRTTVVESEDIVEDLHFLKEVHGYTVIGFDMASIPLTKMAVQKKKTVYVFGSESHGIEPAVEKLLDARYTIPGSGRAESLNLSVAAGIVFSKLT